MNPRLGTWRLAILWLLLWAMILNASCNGNSTPHDAEVIKTSSDTEASKKMTPFVGGTFDASGVAAIAGTDGVLFVDNKERGRVLWMRLDQNGRQAGEIKPIELGVDIGDLEGITTDGTYFYVVSSQSKRKSRDEEGLVRFKFNAQSHSAEEVESISGLADFLFDNIAELGEEGDRKGKKGGLNIEGLAWDSPHGRLLLGLRSPIIDGQALLAPLKFRNPRGPFSVNNIEVETPGLIRLSLGGIGIRDIQYDERSKVFRLLSGAAEDQDQTDFILWEWNGEERQPQLRETKRFDRSLKPEGVGRAKVGGRDVLIIVFDSSGYTILE